MKKITRSFGPIFLLLIILSSCAPSRFVKPLEKGQHAVTGSLGGALLKFGGAVIPLPITTLGYGYGVKENLTVFGNIHPTAAAFGIIQLDAGVTYSPLMSKGLIPGLSISPKVNFGIDVWEGIPKLWPSLDLNAWWNYSTKRDHYVYCGLTNWFELSGKRAHDEKQRHNYIPSPQIGHSFNWSKWSLTTEFKYLAPNVPSRDLAADYVAFGNNGALGFYLGLVKKF